MITLKFAKTKPDAKVPTRGTNTSAGWDLYATDVLYTYDYIEYGTGIKVEIPTGYVGLLFPRSSISKYNLSLCNSVGVIDSCYRGEIMLRFKHAFVEDYATAKHIVQEYEAGEKIGQLIIMPFPEVEWKETEQLSESERGEGGFGSTGK